MKKEFKDTKKLCEELRAETGHSLMDCKIALSKFDYSKEKAIGYLGSNQWKRGKLI